MVSALDSYSTALVGSLSSEYLHLPMLSIAGTAARAEDHDGEEDGSGNNGSYLLHMQPGIVSHMQAIVRLILDMKLARDAVDGRCDTKAEGAAGRFQNKLGRGEEAESKKEKVLRHGFGCFESALFLLQMDVVWM